MSAWIKPTSASSFDFVINKRGIGEFGNTRGLLFGIKDTGSGWALSTLLDDGLGNIAQCDGCGYSYPYNTLTHIGLVRERDELKLYVNGELDSIITGLSIGSIENALPMLFGGNNIHNGSEGIFTNQFSGVIDEVRIFSGALQNSDIRASYMSSNETLHSTNVSSFISNDPSGTPYARDVVYQAPNDMVITASLGGGRCDRNNALIRVGKTVEELESNTYVARVGGYNSMTAIVAKGEFWKVNHYSRYSSCSPTITSRFLF
jgi:hypothetical protein